MLSKYAVFALLLLVWFDLLRSSNATGILQNTTIPQQNPPVYYNSSLANQPIRVYVSAQVNLIQEVDATADQYDLDAYVSFFWRDDRLQSTVDSGGNINLADVTGTGANGITKWWPAPEFMNIVGNQYPIQWSVFSQNGLPLNIPSNLAIEYNSPNDVWITAYVRLQVKMTVIMDLHDFPFDQQLLTIEMQSANYANTGVVFVSVPSNLAALYPLDSHGNIEGWDILSTSADNEDVYYASYDASWDRLKLGVLVARGSSYFLGRYFLGVELFVYMGFFSMAMKGNRPERLLVIIGAFTGVVSWLFILVLSTPPLGYNTRLDKFFTTSIVTIFLQFAYCSLRIGYFKRVGRWLGLQNENAEVEEEGAPEEDPHESHNSPWRRVQSHVVETPSSKEMPHVNAALQTATVELHAAAGHEQTDSSEHEGGHMQPNPLYRPDDVTLDVLDASSELVHRGGAQDKTSKATPDSTTEAKHQTTPNGPDHDDKEAHKGHGAHGHAEHHHGPSCLPAQLKPYWCLYVPCFTHNWDRLIDAWVTVGGVIIFQSIALANLYA